LSLSKAMNKILSFYAGATGVDNGWVKRFFEFDRIKIVPKNGLNPVLAEIRLFVQSSAMGSKGLQSV
jgi:hypothetical protein